MQAFLVQPNTQGHLAMLGCGAEGSVPQTLAYLVRPDTSSIHIKSASTSCSNTNALLTRVTLGKQIKKLKTTTTET